MLKIFSVAVNFIEKWSSDRFSCFTLQVILNTYSYIDFPVSLHLEIIHKNKYLSRFGGRKVYSLAERKLFSQRKTLAEKSYMANPGILLSYNGGMEYHTA